MYIGETKVSFLYDIYFDTNSMQTTYVLKKSGLDRFHKLYHYLKAELYDEPNTKFHLEQEGFQSLDIQQQLKLLKQDA
jgi:hypothetical protein